MIRRLRRRGDIPSDFAVMGRLDLEVPENRERIATWKQQPGMLGVRLFSVKSNTPGWLEDGNADWFWPAAEKADIGVMVYASGNLPLVKKVAERASRP